MTTATTTFRLCYAAAHVVMKDDYFSVAHRHDAPGDAETIAAYVDWDATTAVRTRLDAFGFGIAEAMDTAQRFSLGWTSARELLTRCGALDLNIGFVGGAGYDQTPSPANSAELIDAVVEQAVMIEDLGGEVILLPMPWLTAHKAEAATYVEVYNAIVRALRGPVYIHWLGEAFMPALKGYLPGDSFDDVMALDTEKIRGAKISLLDANIERGIRARLLPADQIVLTGDDFNFGALMRGDHTVSRTTAIGRHVVPIGGFSHALLGILDAVAEPVSRAIATLQEGDAAAYDAIMGPCEQLGRWIFQEPTQFYKSGLAFLSWINGVQDNPMLVNHEERNRPRAYYERTLELAKRAEVIADTASANARMNDLDRYIGNDG